MAGLASLFSRAAPAQTKEEKPAEILRPKTVASRIADWHASLASPGTWDGLHRDARGVAPGTALFDGGKVEIAKNLSSTFQTSHGFSAGSASAPPSYALGAVHASGGTLLHALVDGAGALQGKAVLSSVPLSDAQPGRAAARLIGQVHLMPARMGESSVQLEADLSGGPVALNAKAINPDPSDGMCGVYAASVLHALGPRLAAGLEVVGQRFPASLLGRGTSGKGKLYAFEHGVNAALRLAEPGAWTLALSLQQASALHASYWHRVSPAVELGAEMQALFRGPPARRDANASVAARFDYRQACVRASVDTLGRVAMLYEERVLPGLSLLLAGELDHARGAHRFGVGVTLEN